VLLAWESNTLGVMLVPTPRVSQSREGEIQPRLRPATPGQILERVGVE
jgi:hypothetical protein